MLGQEYRAIKIVQADADTAHANRLPRKRSLSVDVLKGLAILAVILQHSLSRPTFAGIGGPMYVLQAVAVFMLLAGFNSAQSYARRGVAGLADGYRPALLWQSARRLLLPYLVVWLLEALLVLRGPALTDKGYLGSLLSGGWGWGSYFIPVIVCHVLLFPLLYQLARRSLSLLLPLAFALDAGFELLSYHLGLPNQVHEAVYLRYLFAVALGAWLAMARPRARWIVLLAALGGVYVWALEYGGVVLPLNAAWQSRAAPSFAYALAFVVVGLLLLPRVSHRLGWRALGGLGRASYHIFLVQGIYFWRLYSPPHLPELLGAGLALALLPVAGWLFYQLDGLL